MNENKKRGWAFISVLIVISIFIFVVGFFAGRGRVNIKIADAEATVVELTGTVKGLNKTIKLARIENEELRRIYEEDQERIGELEEINTELSSSNKEITKLFERQGQLIKEILVGNLSIGKSNSKITKGLEQVIGSIDSIIKSIQDRED